MDAGLTQNPKNLMLIVDDDEINRVILKNMFLSDFIFEEAENGLVGLRKIEQYEDELCAVLLDVSMPVMDGVELLKILFERDILTKIPVFLITSNEELNVAKVAYELGVMGIINKPVVPFIAVRRVELVVELFRVRDALNVKVRRQERKLQENVETIDALHRKTIEAMASAIEFRDVESGEHTNRIYGITKAILQQTQMGDGFTPEEIENIAVGSILHDVGKIAISDVILNKPGKLTKEEFETMKGHTVKGAALMERLNQMQSHPSYLYAWDIALHHHERWDGRGYPDGLKGDEITVWSQVVSIADVYDALVSPRVYKKAFHPDQAVKMICNGECGVFNPKLLESFLQVEPELRRWYLPDENGTYLSASSDANGQEKRLSPTQVSGDPRPSRELVDMLLMTAAVKSAYDLIISVNLTRNTYHMIDYDHALTHCAGSEGKFDDLIQAGALSVPESDRQKFVDAFSRARLLGAYASGKKAVNLNHLQYTDEGQVIEVSTTVLFMEEPRTGDICEITLSRCCGGGVNPRKA